jgi:hypothetical protein
MEKRADRASGVAALFAVSFAATAAERPARSRGFTAVVDDQAGGESVVIGPRCGMQD